MATTNDRPATIHPTTADALYDTLETALDAYNRGQIGKGSHVLYLQAAGAWALRQSDVETADPVVIAARWLATYGDQDQWFTAGRPFYDAYLADTAHLRHDHPDYSRQTPDAEPESLTVGEA